MFVGQVGRDAMLHHSLQARDISLKCLCCPPPSAPLASQGHKHWVCFHPADAPLLSPTFDDADQIDRFPSLEELAEPANGAERAARANREKSIGHPP
eukprot:6523576-Prymnesium_polylepis.1